MKKHILIFILAPFLSFGQSVSFQPFKALPLRLALTPQGIALNIVGSIATKILGSISASYGFNIFNFSNSAKPAYSSYGYTGSYFNSSNSVTNFKTEQDNSFILIIKYKQEKYLYTISGYEEIEITTDGKTVLKAGKEKLEIDVTNAEIEKIVFRGKEIKGTNPQILTQANKELGEMTLNDIETILPYADGIAFGYTKKGNFAVLDKSMKIIANLPYTDINCYDNHNFLYGKSSCNPNFAKTDGLIGVKGKNGLWGFIDRNFNLVIPCRYEYVDNFDNKTHTCTVGLKNNLFKIDKRGIIVE